METGEDAETVILTEQRASSKHSALLFLSLIPAALSLILRGLNKLRQSPAYKGRFLTLFAGETYTSRWTKAKRGFLEGLLQKSAPGLKH